MGVFMQPSHPPEGDIYDCHKYDLDYLVLLDQCGYDEAWIGEHFLAPWEPNPAPDLLIAQALMRTKRIIMAAGVHNLPYHHPAELAHRVAYLDHMAQGRFRFGVGSSGTLSDWVLFNVDGHEGENRKMTRESLDIIMKIWENKGPFDYKGEYWHVTIPDTMHDTLKFFLTPYQKPHPPIGIAAASKRSPTMVLAGERGYIPLCLAFNLEYTRSQWEAYEEGAHNAGRTPSRSEWRLVRNVYVADTDEEARDQTLNGMTARVYNEYSLKIYKANPKRGILDFIKHDPEVPDEAVTVEYLADHMWLIGSPETVAGKIRKLYTDVGGFGGLIVLVYDHSASWKAWEKSTRLLADKVMPMVADLTGD